MKKKWVKGLISLQEIETLQPLKGTIVEVNSTPPQQFVAVKGNYSLTLAPGSYSIKASFFSNNTLAAFTEENVTVAQDGDFVLDLILFPEIDFENDLDAINGISDNPFETTSQDNNALYAIALIALLLGGAAFYYTTRKIKDEKQVVVVKQKPRAVSRKQEPKLSSDVKGLYEMIKSEKRVTQKDLRKKMPQSEAKVSLMLAELEDKGLVKKIKKGRGNIIILEK